MMRSVVTRNIPIIAETKVTVQVTNIPHLGTNAIEIDSFRFSELLIIKS